MKKLTLLFLLFTLKGYSQHTDSSLSCLSKMQLVNIYIDEVNELAFHTPYTPFTIGVSDTIKGDLDIPVSKYLAKKRNAIMNVSEKYTSAVKEQLYEIIPYSDKKDIIRAILFLQETNNNIFNK